MSKARKDESWEAAAAEGQADETAWESIDEIRQAMGGKHVPTASESAAAPAGAAFRPVHRPPMALLCILDDGLEEGEWLRIRTDRVVIGRSTGDILIPHDTMMSTQHAEISRRLDKGRYRWYLIDLKSTNGTFVRVNHATLKHGQEMLIGGQRYRFDAAPPGDPSLVPAAGGPAGQSPGGTRAWQGIAAADLFCSLIEVTPKGPGKRFLLNAADNWIGSDPARCSVVLAGDPLVAPRHARLSRDKAGRWRLETARSLNGTWVRVHKVPIEIAGQFQLGEQRFVVRALG